MSTQLGVEEWWLEVKTGLKCVYAGEVYSLGENVYTLSALKDIIRSAISYLSNQDFHLAYTDPDGDLILLTTDQSLLEAYCLTEGGLRLQVKSRVVKAEAEVYMDQYMDYNRLNTSLASVFLICLEKKAIGLGAVISPNTGVCVCRALECPDTIAHAYALFSQPGFPFYFHPELTSIRNGLIFLRFRHAIDAKPIEIDRSLPQPGKKLLTLHRVVNNNPKACLKWVEIKTVEGDTFDYDCKEPCGANGSPVFTPDFRLFGMQLTDSTLHNTAISFNSFNLPSVEVIEILD